MRERSSLDRAGELQPHLGWKNVCALRSDCMAGAISKQMNLIIPIKATAMIALPNFPKTASIGAHLRSRLLDRKPLAEN